jgi:hypothetical protein
MPYSIEKLSNGKYEVKVTHTGQILSKGTTLSKAKKQIRYLGMREHIKGGRIQSVLFGKKKNTQKKADAWLKKNDFKIDKSTYNFDSPNYFRYRQHDPDDKKYDYRMYQIDPQTDIYFVLEYEKKKPLKGGALNASTLKNVLKSGYKQIDDQEKNIDGYIRDDSLSGRRHQVYYHPETKEAIISHRGTEGSIKDWMNNAAYATGLYHHTSRYKVAKDAQAKAEAKYGANNLNTIGHSQGAMIANDLGKQSKNIISVDRPAKLSDVFFKKTGKNHQDIRTSNDIVSSMIPYQRMTNKPITIASKTYNPIKEHDLDHLDELSNHMIGSGIFHKYGKKIAQGIGLTAAAYAAHQIYNNHKQKQEYEQFLKDNPNFDDKNFDDSWIYKPMGGRDNNKLQR